MLSSATGINFLSGQTSSTPCFCIPTSPRPSPNRTKDPTHSDLQGFCIRFLRSRFLKLTRAEIHAGRVVLACQRSKVAVHYTGLSEPSEEYVGNSLPVNPHVPQCADRTKQNRTTLSIAKRIRNRYPPLPDRTEIACLQLNFGG